MALLPLTLLGWIGSRMDAGTLILRIRKASASTLHESLNVRIESTEFWHIRSQHLPLVRRQVPPLSCEAATSTKKNEH